MFGAMVGFYLPRRDQEPSLAACQRFGVPRFLVLVD